MEKIEHLWWPTPVWEVKTNFDSEFNQNLIRELKELQFAKDRYGDSNIWWKSEENEKLKNLNILKAEMAKIISEATMSFRSKYQGTVKLTRGWVNFINPGQQYNIHYHGFCPYAVTYYISAPENCGDLILIDPLAGQTNEIVNDGNVDGAKYKRLKPEEGKLVFFPGYLLHMVEENKSGQTRISLSTNTQFDY
jgi:uncharacterized protein (TIGR02466 family)